MKPNEKQVDLSSVAQQVGALSGQNADEFKGRNIVGVYDKDRMLSVNEQIDTPNGRQLKPVMRNGQPINLSPKTQQMMSTLHSESLGFKTPDKKDSYLKLDKKVLDANGNEISSTTFADPSTGVTIREGQDGKIEKGKISVSSPIPANQEARMANAEAILNNPNANPNLKVMATQYINEQKNKAKYQGSDQQQGNDQQPDEYQQQGGLSNQ
jgi:hypothetical protein